MTRLKIAYEKEIVAKLMSKLALKNKHNILDLQKSLEDQTGLSVSISNKKNNSGSIIFEYQDLDQLDKLINTIKKNY